MNVDQDVDTLYRYIFDMVTISCDLLMQLHIHMDSVQDANFQSENSRQTGHLSVSWILYKQKLQEKINEMKS